MENEWVKEWVRRLPSCLENRSSEFDELAHPERREHHIECLAAEGWCPACGRAVAGYDVKIRGGDRLLVWTDDHDKLLAADLSFRLIVWPEGEKNEKTEHRERAVRFEKPKEE